MEIMFCFFHFAQKNMFKKKWPYYSELIVKIKEFYKNRYPVLVAPGPDEIDEAKKLKCETCFG